MVHSYSQHIEKRKHTNTDKHTDHRKIQEALRVSFVPQTAVAMPHVDGAKNRDQVEMKTEQKGD